MIAGMFMAVAAAAAGRAGAAGALSAAAVSRRKAQQAVVYEQRSGLAQQQFQEKQAFRAQIEAERREFDRAAAADRQIMISALQGLTPNERRLANERFAQTQRAKRRELDRKLDSERRGFDRWLGEQRGDAQRALKRRRAELKEQQLQ